VTKEKDIPKECESYVRREGTRERREDLTLGIAATLGEETGWEERSKGETFPNIKSSLERGGGGK